jgi:hypothetical protein
MRKAALMIGASLLCLAATQAMAQMAPAASWQDPVKAYAQKYRPVLKHNLEMAQAIAIKS